MGICVHELQLMGQSAHWEGALQEMMNITSCNIENRQLVKRTWVV